MSLSVLNSLPSTHVPAEAAVQPKAPVATPAVASVSSQPKTDTVSISPAAHQAADGDHDAS